MTNDRTQGLLVFDIKTPYKVSVNGEFEERTGIICHEMNNKTSCNTAADMEQVLLTAFYGLERKAGNTQTKKQMQKEEKEENDFYENNSPSNEDVKERADQLKLLFKMQREVKTSEIMGLFEELVTEKLLSTEGDVKMYGNVWESIDYQDQTDIMWRYIVFFVNPLQSLSQTDMTESKGENTKSETRS